MGLQKLPLVLNQGIIISKCLKEHNNKLKATLTETGDSSTLTEVIIEGLSHNAMVLALDKIKSHTLFKQGKGQNTRCDYLIINDQTIFFIEMKSREQHPSTNKGKDIINKYRASECILVYIDEVLIEFYGELSKFFGNKEKRYVLLYLTPSIYKTTTSRKPPSKPEINNTPGNFLRLPVGKDNKIYLQELSI